MDANSFAQKPVLLNSSHIGIIFLTAVMLLGVSWMKNPSLFSFNKSNTLVANENVPKYYAYVAPAEDTAPQVLGANTLPQGPSIITDDGQVVPVDLGQVLGASTQGIELSLDNVKVNIIPDSNQAIRKYFSDSQNIEKDSVADATFGAALNSGDQAQINLQAQKLVAVRDAMLALPVPQSLVKLQKIKIVQYNSAIDMLQNFTLGDQNPELLNTDLQQFLKSQQDLDDENVAVAQKFPNDDPNSAAYINFDASTNLNAQK